MSDLARRTALSTSRIVTRLVDELASAGLVVKVRSDSDGRGNLAQLAAAGMQRRCAAHPLHLQRPPRWAYRCTEEIIVAASNG
jgi:DNA-binding MarR family transcriptional regulator